MLSLAVTLVGTAQFATAGESGAPDRPDKVVSLESKLHYAPPTWPEAPDTAAMLLRLGLGTAAVLALSVLTLWTARRWLRGSPLPGPGGCQLRIVAAIPLGNRCSVYLLQAGSRQVLAGTDGSGLKTLVALPELFENTLTEVQQSSEADAEGTETDAARAITR